LNLKSENSESVFSKLKNVDINYFSGPHPAGNVGIQIHHLNPINKGEVVWYINPQELAMIGRLFANGKLDAKKTVALVGSEVKKPQYFETMLGASIDKIIANNISENENRIISGNVLTGSLISMKGFVGFYDSMISVIPEGNKAELLGWGMPGFGKFSVSRTFCSWMTPKRKYALNTNMKGGLRSFVVTGEYDKVFPMDILPQHLLKAIIIEDIDQMEELGIYEIAEEDFALCEFVCTSKINVQEIVRNGLNIMIKEMN
jgi:Na+-transporting NADH:ubiquinone oxidoreductase subunit A